MKKFSSSKSSFNVITFSLLGAVLLLFLFYFFVYVPQAERKINNKAFHVIEDFHTQFLQKIKDQQNRIESRLSSNNYTLADYRKDSLPLIHPILLFGDTSVAMVSGSHHKTEIDIRFEVPETYKDSVTHSGYRQTLSEFLKPFQTSSYFSAITIYDTQRIVYSSDPFLGLNLLPDTLFPSASNTSNANLYMTSVSNQENNYRLYVFPMRLSEKQTLYFAGIREEAKITGEARKVGHFLVLMLSTTILLIVLFMPLIKMRIMSPFERLSKQDIFFAGFSLIIGLSFITLFLLSSKDHVIDQRQQENRLDALNQQIANNFKEEIDIALFTLDSLENGLNDSSLLTNNNNPLSLTKKANQKELILINDKGKGRLVWQKDTSKENFEIKSAYLSTELTVENDSNVKEVNIKKRSYYLDLMNDKVWTHEKTSFAFQRIMSYLDDTREVAISKKVTVNRESEQGFQPFAVALITKFPSLDYTVLPPGYQFCIVDPSGKVIFHSNEKKILMENFVEEITKGNEFRELIQARSSLVFNSVYDGQEHILCVRPLINTNLTLVTLYDTEVQGIADYYVFFYAFFYITLIGFYVFLLALGVKWVTHSESLLDKKTFSYRWLAFDLSKHKEYRYLFVVYLISTFYLISFIFSDGGLVNNIIRVLSVLSFLSLINFQMLCDTSNTTNEKRKAFLASHVLIQLIWCGLLLKNECNGANVLHLLLLLPVSLYFVILYPAPEPDTPSNQDLNPNRPTTLRWYRYFLTLYALCITTLSTTIGYCDISHLEKSLQLKNAQLTQARAIEKGWHENHLNHSPNGDTLTRECGVYSSLFYQSTARFVNQIDSTVSFESERTPLDSVLNDFYLRRKPGFAHNLELYNNSLLLHHPRDSTFDWSGQQDSTDLWYRLLKPVADKTALSYVHIGSSHKLEPNDPLGTRILWWIMIVIFLLILISWLLNYLLEKAFNIRLIEKLENPPTHKENNTNTNLFLIGYEQYALRQFAQQSFLAEDIADIEDEKDREKRKEELTESIDCIQYDFKTFKYNRDKKLYVLSHFEHQLFDQEKLGDVLTLIEQLLVQRTHIAICSASSFNFIFDELDRHLALNDSNLDTSEKKHMINRWISVFRKFNRIIRPLVAQQPAPAHPDLHHGMFLYNVNDKIDLPEREDEQVFAIQDISEAYYYYIWQSSTTFEKLILLDLAQDGIINPKNLSVIRQLYNKGVIVDNNGLQLMNESFRNFILTSYAEDEINKIAPIIDKGGSWSRYRSIILILVIAAFIFLMFSEELFNRVLTILTAGAAMLPLVIRISQAFIGGFSFGKGGK